MGHARISDQRCGPTPKQVDAFLGPGRILQMIETGGRADAVVNAPDQAV
jgi:hypothetical protein